MICTRCGGNELQQVGQNLWCPNCGFFPIPFEQEEKEMIQDPPEAQPTGRLVGPGCRPTFHITEDKYPKARVIPAAFWISYFTLHWLTILGVVPTCTTNSGITIYFLIAAILSTLVIDAAEHENE